MYRVSARYFPVQPVVVRVDGYDQPGRRPKANTSRLSLIFLLNGRAFLMGGVGIVPGSLLQVGVYSIRLLRLTAF